MLELSIDNWLDYCDINVVPRSDRVNDGRDAIDCQSPALSQGEGAKRISAQQDGELDFEKTSIATS